MSVDHQWREQINAAAREQLAQSGILRVRVVTTSMQPLIRAGETIVVQPAEAKSFALGDIALFRQGEVWLAHRLVARTADGQWLTKGDRAPSCDKMQVDEWIGRVTTIENATHRFDLRHASFLMRLTAFLSLCAARAEEKQRRGQARMWRVLTRGAALSIRVLSKAARA